MYNYCPMDFGFHPTNVNVDPTDEELLKLAYLKHHAEEALTTQTTYALADYYYQNGALSAARFWARLWVVVLWAKGMSKDKEDDHHQFNCAVRMLGYAEPDEFGDDEIVYMYG